MTSSGVYPDEFGELFFYFSGKYSEGWNYCVHRYVPLGWYLSYRLSLFGIKQASDPGTISNKVCTSYDYGKSVSCNNRPPGQKWTYRGG